MPLYFDSNILIHLMKEHRGERPLREVATEIGAVSASTLSRIENGQISDLDTFIKVCNWLGQPPAVFIRDSSPVISSDEVEGPVQQFVAQLRQDPNLDANAASVIASATDAMYQTLRKKSAQQQNQTTNGPR